MNFSLIDNQPIDNFLDNEYEYEIPKIEQVNSACQKRGRTFLF